MTASAPEQIEEGISIVDRTLRFVYVDGILASFHGKKARDYPGKEVASLLPSHIWTLVGPIYSHVIRTHLSVPCFEFETQSPYFPGITICRARYSPTASGGVHERMSYTRKHPWNTDHTGLTHSNYDLRVAALTGMEMSVTEFLALGKCTKEIAVLLHLSCHTIATHRKHICKKTWSSLNSRVGYIGFRVLFGGMPEFSVSSYPPVWMTFLLQRAVDGCGTQDG